MFLLPFIFCLLILEASSFDHCSFTSKHILCKDFPSHGTKCPQDVQVIKLTKSDKGKIVSILNFYGKEYAIEKTEELSRLTNPVAMQEMKWDEELASTAAKIASKCRVYKSCPKCLDLERFSSSHVQHLFHYPSKCAKKLPWEIYLKSLVRKHEKSTRMGTKHDSPEDKHFPSEGHFLSEATSAVGCSLVIFHEFNKAVHNFVCAFGPVGPEHGKPLHFSAKGAREFCPVGSPCSTTGNIACACREDCHPLNNKRSNRIRRADAPAKTTVPAKKEEAATTVKAETSAPEEAAAPPPAPAPAPAEGGLVPLPPMSGGSGMLGGGSDALDDMSGSDQTQFAVALQILYVVGLITFAN